MMFFPLVVYKGTSKTNAKEELLTSEVPSG